MGTSQGFSSNMADQKVSLSPHPREIPGRSQFVKSWFPRVSPDHAGSLQEGGTCLFPQVPAGINSTAEKYLPKLTPRLGLGVQGRGIPCLCCRPPFSQIHSIIQDKNEPSCNREDTKAGGASEHGSALRRRGTGSVNGGGRGEKERQWGIWRLGNCLAAQVAERPPPYKCFSFVSWTGWGGEGSLFPPVPVRSAEDRGAIPSA